VTGILPPVDFAGVSLLIRHRERLLGACSAVGTALVLVLVIFTPSAWAAPTISEFTTGSSTGPEQMTLGPDGNVWFVETVANKIGRVTPAGVVTTFWVGLSSSAGLAGITAGPDGNLWFTESSNDQIGRITTSGVITEYSLDGGSDPHGITAGPDGALWFAETTDDEIGRMTTGGSVTNQFPVPGSGNNPYGIAAGADGNLWFTERTSGGGIGRITTTGTITEFGPTTGLPSGIAAGPDGNLWFADTANPGSIGRITPTGTITQFSTGLTTNGDPLDIVAGDDGNLYFTENSGGGRLGQITPAGVITEFTTGLTFAPWGITNGADGNIWFTESGGNRVGRLTVAPGAATDPATLINPADATLAGTVRPRSQATTYSFDWGLTNGYGSTTATFNAGSGASAQPVTALISGLAPSATYHFRVVATNATGTTLGADRTFMTSVAPPFGIPVTLAAALQTPASVLPPVTRPVLGRSATIAATSGEILVKLPGTGVYLPLSAASTVPVGTTIDATRGTLKLTNVRDSSGKLQTGRFWGGSFTFRQTRGKQASTVLTLAAPLNCPKSARHLVSAMANKPRARQLWGRDNNGRFVTRGRSAVATVRGTAWFTRDTCAGTRVTVTRGTVDVRDLVRGRTVIVRAGHSYLARLR
jgi:virginiamycin B lyase